MKIDAYDFRTVDLPLVEGYRITGKTITSCQNHLVRLRSGPLTGYGSASPSGDVTGEHDASCAAALGGALADITKGAELGDDTGAWWRKAAALASSNPAACAAVDMALWDLIARKAGKPLVEVWGGAPVPIPTSVTIGICDAGQTLREADGWLAQKFFVLKIKIGEDLDADVDRLRRLRAHVGPDITIRVDANQGYDLAGAKRLLAETADLDIEMFEQPLPKTDLDGLASLTRESTVPVIADESAGSVEQCRAVIDRRAGHGVNIKLMKCGGPTAARAIHDYAVLNGMDLMLGCNDETRISIAAGVHLAQSMPGLRYADLDGHMDLAADPSRGGFEIRDGRLYVVDVPGLGVDVDW